MMTRTNVAKTKRETHAQVMVYMLLMNLDVTEFLSRVLWDVDALYVRPGRWRELYRMESDRFYPGSDPLSVQWLEGVDWDALSSGSLDRVRRSVGDDFDSAVYQPVFWRVVLRAWLESRPAVPFDIVQDENEHPRSGGSPDFHGLPIVGQRDSEDYAADGTGEGVVSMEDLAAALEMTLPNREGLSLDELMPSYCND